MSTLTTVLSYGMTGLQYTMSGLDYTAKAIRFTAEVADVAVTKTETISQRANATLKVLAIALQTIPYVITMKDKNTQLDLCTNLKQKEILVRVLRGGLVVHLAESKKRAGMDMASEFWATLRNVSEYAALGVEHYINMSDEERSKIMVPIYEHKGYDSDGDPISVKVGERPLTLADCIKRQTTVNGLSSLLGLGEGALRVLTCIDEMIRAERRLPQAFVRAALRQTNVPINYNLLTLEKIPELFAGDEELARHTCPITLEPIRFAMRSRINPEHVYEANAILTWVQARGTSPLTRAALTVNDLEPAQDIQDMINARLATLSVLLQEVMENLRRQNN